MSPDIWTQCAQKFKFSSFDGNPYRVVEAQHIIATRKLVDSDEEQAVLEDLIDEAKPRKPYDDECKSYHYLLWTPFRYPPLPYGSRFGSPDRRGLWYGSMEIETAFAEKAYYTFLLRSGSKADFGVFDTHITTFCVSVSTRASVDLTRLPFKKFEKELTAPDSYTHSQRIGSELRDQNTEVICFKPARYSNSGVNIAIIKISAFKNHKPQEANSWFCTSSEKTVEFKPAGPQSPSAKRTIFQLSDFEIDGKLPSPQLGR